jgi:TRAP-type C4-dicarboxylate transport system permease small subunit
VIVPRSDLQSLCDILVAETPDGGVGRVIATIDTIIRTGCALVLMISFWAMLLPTFFNAVLRYTTNTSLVWSVEIVQLTFPWFIMAGAVLAAQHMLHIRVQLLLTLLPRLQRRWLTVPVQGLIAMTCLMVVYVYLGFGLYEGGMAFAAGDVAFTSLGVPQSWSYLALLCGYMLLGITALTAIYRLLHEDVN